MTVKVLRKRHFEVTCVKITLTTCGDTLRQSSSEKNTYNEGGTKFLVLM